MSTQKIEEMVTILQNLSGDLFPGERRVLRAARNELVAIRRAARAMEKHGWLDFCRAKFMVHRDEEAALHLVETIAKEREL